MRRMVMVVSASACMASLTFAAAASASGTQPGNTYSTGFEASQGFTTLGSIDGQGTAPATWSSRLSQAAGAPPYDQAVTGTNPISPSQSFRQSNAVADGEFGDQTHAPTLTVPAGESVTNRVFDAAFKIKSTSSQEQRGLSVSVSPDDGVGGRMSYVRFDDESDGIHVFVVDNPVDADQRQTEWGTVLKDRTTPHTVRFWIKFVPGANDDGTDNDIVRVFVDGHDIGDETHTCFTSWGQWYRFGENREPPPTSSLTFMARGSSVPGVAGGGYLFDDVSYTSSDGTGPRRGNCGIEVDKTTQTQSAQPNQLVTYRITARNRSNVAARGVRACDVPPRALTFVRSSAPLHRATGGRLCLTIPVLGPGQRKSFDATFRLAADTAGDTVTNGGIVDLPIFPIGSDRPREPPIAVAPNPGVPPTPARAAVRRVVRAKIIVRVIKSRPRVTG